MFTKKDIVKLIIPLIIEQVLIMTIGMADTIMVAGVGEEAVSAVSIVDSINILLINVFTALSTGGAVVAAQFLGRRDTKNASVAAKQLLFVSAAFSITIMTICILGNSFILNTLFGNMDERIMQDSMVYFKISALSYPALALYNSGAAIFRSMGNSKVSMVNSLIMNIVNISANYTFIYILDMGVAGAALGSLIARTVSAICVLTLLKLSKGDIQIKKLFKLDINTLVIKNILSIGIPNSIENSMFQIGKILVQGLVVSFGTSAIAANAVSSSIANIAIIPGMAVGLAMITVVGQCVGAGDFEQAKKYIKMLTLISTLSMATINIIIAFSSPFIIAVYKLTEATAETTQKIIIYHSICAIFIWAISFTLPHGLRASNDVKFTMIVATISMWVFRIAFSYVLGKYMNMGVFGIWVAMTIDWLFRAIVFSIRYFSGKWQKKAFI